MIGQAQRTYYEVAYMLGLPVWMVRKIERSALAKIRRDKQLRRLNSDAKRETRNEGFEYSHPSNI